MAHLARCNARKQPRLFGRGSSHELDFGVREGRRICFHTLSKGQQLPRITFTLLFCNEVHLMEVLSLAQRGPEPTEDIEIIDPTGSMEIGELSTAEIEEILKASVAADVPQDGTPAYFEYFAPQKSSASVS